MLVVKWIQFTCLHPLPTSGALSWSWRYLLLVRFLRLIQYCWTCDRNGSGAYFCDLAKLTTLQFHPAVAVGFWFGRTHLFGLLPLVFLAVCSPCQCGYLALAMWSSPDAAARRHRYHDTPAMDPNLRYRDTPETARHQSRCCGRWDTVRMVL